MHRVQLYFAFVCVFLRACAGESCNEDWKPVTGNNGLLRYSKQAMTLNDATIKCENLGAVLASVTSTEITSLMKSVMVACHTNLVLISDSSNSGSLDAQNQVCSAVTVAGTVIQHNCSTALNFFCYKDQAHSGNLSISETEEIKGDAELPRPPCVERWEPVPEVDGLLRFHSLPATWSEAVLRCNLEGGILASPSYHTIKSAMTQKMEDHQQTGAVFIGIRAVLSEPETYVSLDGTPFSYICPTWVHGQPDNLNNSQECLVMRDNGEVADEDCDSVFRYFCFRSIYHPVNNQTERLSGVKRSKAAPPARAGAK